MKDEAIGRRRFEESMIKWGDLLDALFMLCYVGIFLKGQTATGTLYIRFGFFISSFSVIVSWRFFASFLEVWNVRVLKEFVE